LSWYWLIGAPHLEQQAALPEQQAALLEQRVASPGQQAASLEQREASREQQAASLEQREAWPGQREAYSRRLKVEFSSSSSSASQLASTY